MTDIDPEIFDKNPTLGKAAQNTRLDVIEKQELENRNAAIEGRDARKVVVDNDYPGWTQPVSEKTGTVSSNAQVVHFADAEPHEIPEGAGASEKSAGKVTKTSGK